MKSIKEQILNYAKRTYQTVPDAPFRTAPGYLVLRHADTRKWYALIMDIDRAKLGLSGRGDVDILNIKCDPELAALLRRDDGFLPAYHMNHESWLTVLLDGAVPVRDIYPLLDMSYALTQAKGKRSNPLLRNTNWIVPANLKYYDLPAAINENPEHTFIWKQSNRIAVGDIVYLYVAAPLSAIRYKCRAIEVDIPYRYADANVTVNRVMRLQLLATYDKTPIDLTMLKDHGVYTVRGPRGIPASLIEEIDLLYPAE